MIVTGNFLTETTTYEGLKWFTDMYGKTPQKIMEQDLRVRVPVADWVKAIVCPEYDGTINQSFVLEDGDTLFAVAEGCCDTYFNTDGIAFMELWREGKMVSQWAFENSPYEMSHDDLIDCDFDMSKLPEGLTFKDVLFVAQL